MTLTFMLKIAGFFLHFCVGITMITVVFHEFIFMNICTSVFGLFAGSVHFFSGSARMTALAQVFYVF